jgi:NAD(P)-dependent dehydrogenase (short-subunit alcohol dehydrogenase family)
MTRLLEGKTVLVTGASRGIGRAIAVRLAAAGALVCAHCGTNSDAALETVRQIEAAGGRAFAIRADLARLGEIRESFATLDREISARGASGLDILVNNAGVGVMGRVADCDEATFDRLFNVNVKGMFFVTQLAIPRLNDGGRIINISSMVSVAAYPICIVYAQTKAAVNSLTRSLAAELGPRRITVNAVAPGATATDFIGDLMKDTTMIAALEAGAALGRIGAAGDIARVVAFLASPDGGWITGQVIQASGGMHL